jgi:outer membrane protein TolC
MAAKAAGKRYEAAKLQLFYDVKDAFYEYAYLAAAIEIAKENLDLVTHFEEVARSRYAAAAASHPDVIRAQIELATLEDKLKALEELRRPIVARLNAVLNRRAEASLPWPDRQPYQAVVIDRQSLYEILRQQNPQLRAMDFDVIVARTRVELAKKRFYPDLGVGLDWIETDEAASGVRDSGKDPIILMFSMNLPIWRRSYDSAQVQARAEARRAQHLRREAENDLVAAAEQAFYSFEDSDRKVRLYGAILVPKAEELIAASETAYTAGAADFLSLIDAEQMLLRFKLEHERAQVDRQQHLAQLEMLVGAEPSVEAAETIID